MATISSLVVEISAQTSKLAKGLNDADAGVKNFVSKTKARLTKLKNAFGAVASGVTAIAKAAAAGGAAVAGFVTGLGLQAGQIRDMSNMARTLGMSTKALQEWQYAARRVGIDGEKLADIFKDTGEKLGELAATGGGQAAEVMDVLGVKAEKFINLKPHEAFLELSKAMQGLSQQKKIFVLEAFASDSSKLLPLLDKNAEGFRNLQAEARATGNVLSDWQIAGVQAFDASLSEMMSSARGFWKQTTAYLAGPVQVLMDELGKAIKSFGGVQAAARAFAVAIVDGMVWVVQSLSNVVEKFYEMQLAINSVQGAYAALQAGPLGAIGEKESAEWANQATQYANERLQIEQKIANIKGVQNKADEIAARVRGAFDKSTAPEVQNTEATTQNTDAISQLSGNLIKATEAQADATNVMQKVFGEKKPRDVVDITFASYLRSIQQQAQAGNAGETTRLVKAASEHLERLGSRDTLYTRTLDIKGMKAAIAEVLKEVNKKPEQVGELKIDVMVNGRRLVSRIKGDPVALKELKDLIDDNTQDHARGGAR